MRDSETLQLLKADVAAAREEYVKNAAAMGIPSWIAKADFTTAAIAEPAGALTANVLDSFVQILQAKATILPLANVMMLSSPRQQVPKIRFAGRVMHAGHELTALADAERVKPDTSGVEFNCVTIKGDIPVSRETIEDNVEKDRLISTILNMLGGAVARDMEELTINGDTSLAGTDNFLGLFDGVILQSSTNVLNALSSTFDQNVASDMLRTMPDEFRADALNQRWITDLNSEQNARNSWAARATNAGDAALGSYGPVTWFSRDILASPQMPSDLGGGSDQTVVLLGAMDNFGIGIWRGISIRRAVNNREDGVNYVVTVRFDAKVIEADAVVKAINVQSQ